jgi:hypothetical protein
MITEAITNIKAVLYDRLSSPLFGSFILSWSLWNYKFILLITSSMPPTNKFFIIDTYIYYDKYHIFLNGFLYPLLTSSAIIFIYPYPAKYIYEFWLKKQKELLDIKQNIEGTSLLSLEQSINIRKEIAEIQIYNEKELNEKNNKIESLKQIIIDKDNEIASLNSKVNKPVKINKSSNPLHDSINDILKNNGIIKTENNNDLLTDDEKNILFVFKKYDEIFLDASVFRSKDTKKIAQTLLFDGLLAKNIIENKLDSDTGDEGFALTPKGMKIVSAL